jgi:hypothetical protein
MKKLFLSYTLVAGATAIALSLAAAFPTTALAHCNGTPSDDTIDCTEAAPGNVDLGEGNDSYTDTTAVGAGYILGDNAAGDGATDVITVNGSADYIAGDNANGNGANDTITVNGSLSSHIYGDNANGFGGVDQIVVNGSVGGDVYGDYTNGSGGDDRITINGTVSQDVSGDYLTGGGGNGGNDRIVINGSVGRDVYGDFTISGVGGNDRVTLGVNATVTGTINGEDGRDTLVFAALTQSQVNALGLNPAGDTATINGHTYTWLNFEALLGLIEELAERGLRVFFASESVLAVESDAGDGISIFAEHGRIAFVSFDSLGNFGVGESLVYSTPNSAGWYVVVTNLGADVEHAGKTLYQVNIFVVGGSSAGQFTFSN